MILSSGPMVEFIKGSEQWGESKTREEEGQERTAKGRYQDNATYMVPVLTLT